MLFHTSSFAFDGDRSINRLDFKKESFIDIKSYRPNPTREAKWYEVQNGLRMIEGSLDLDLSYLDREFRFERHFSRRWKVGYGARHYEFYAIKPIKQHFHFTVNAFANLHISFLLLPSYDKRNVDSGWKVHLGDHPWHHLRFSHTQQDREYNEKNKLDESRYRQTPSEDQIEAAWIFSSKLRGRFWWRWDRASVWDSPEEQIRFEHVGTEGELALEYHPSSRSVMALKSTGFHVLKSRTPLDDTTDAEHARQNLLFDSNEAYWTFPIFGYHSLTLGMQHDRIRNILRDIQNPSDSLNYRFETGQVYALWVHPWSGGWDWEYALYLGQAAEEELYVINKSRSEYEQTIESKFRWSLEWSLPKEALLLLVTTWNLDHFADDPWDGGGFVIQMELD